MTCATCSRYSGGKCGLDDGYINKDAKCGQWVGWAELVQEQAREVERLRITGCENCAKMKVHYNQSYLEKSEQLAAANSTMYTEEQMEQFYQDGFNNGQVAAGKRIEQMQRVVDVARIVADCRSGINLKPFAHSHALDAMEKALAELEPK